LKKIKPKHIAILALCFILTPSSYVQAQKPVPITSTVTQYQVIGITSETTGGIVTYRGSSGVRGLNRMCSDKFGPAAIAATLAHWHQTTSSYTPETFRAWIRAADITVHPNGATWDAVATHDHSIASIAHPSPISAVQFLTCAGYNDNSFGLKSPRVVTLGEGSFITLGPCSDSPTPVVCAAPVVIEVPSL